MEFLAVLTDSCLTGYNNRIIILLRDSAPSHVLLLPLSLFAEGVKWRKCMVRKFILVPIALVLYSWKSPGYFVSFEPSAWISNFRCVAIMYTSIDDPVKVPMYMKQSLRRNIFLSFFFFLNFNVKKFSYNIFIIFSIKVDMYVNRNFFLKKKKKS